MEDSSPIKGTFVSRIENVPFGKKVSEPGSDCGNLSPTDHTASNSAGAAPRWVRLEAK